MNFARLILGYDRGLRRTRSIIAVLPTPLSPTIMILKTLGFVMLFFCAFLSCLCLGSFGRLCRALDPWGLEREMIT